MTKTPSPLEAYSEPCPFCNIADAYPAEASCSSASDLARCVPNDEAANPERIQPSCFLVLSAPEVLAFLDIMPMTRGHLLVATRTHIKKVGEVEGTVGREIGFWLPLLARTVARVTGVDDYNIVQNNGVRAAQVVPHVHFHVIPRPPAMPELQNKSWTMFGRGQREDMDDVEGVQLAKEMRRALSEELEELKKKGKL